MKVTLLAYVVAIPALPTRRDRVKGTCVVLPRGTHVTVFRSTPTHLIVRTKDAHIGTVLAAVPRASVATT